MPPLYELTAHQLQSMLSHGDTSSEELVHALFERIERIEGKTKSYITLLKEDALKQARIADKQLKSSKVVGKLTGIPIAVKDNICAHNVRTSCASKMLDNYIPPYNATVVERLLREGAVIIGKTNMDEFAMGSSTETSYYGTTHNPWNLGHVAGGSSGGSGAAIAADDTILALGSDTGGSVRCPASFCNGTGMKVTYGLISRYGLISYACSLEQIGPLTKDVRDCALLLNVLVGHDPLDSTTLQIPKKDYLESLETDMKHLKIGVPREYLEEGTDKAVSKAVWDLIHLLESFGASYDEISLPLINYAVPCYYIIAMSEASSNLARYDGIRYGFRVDKDEGNWNEVYAEDRLAFGPEVRRRIMLGTYALSAGYYDMYYVKALKIRSLIRKEFENQFKSFDVIIGPTMPTTAFKIGEKISDPLAMYRSDIDTVIANITGMPAISIPCGFSDGLPIGVQLMGNLLQEDLLLRISYKIQQETDYHKKKPSLEV
ncbi:MAG: Asp-tRNA(Asn)/Glu-tRNA(Gln) amidotransferase subunit GatA [Candidatus Helarchaeota archaeon]|nr:Asp-tRNA(Asn)/Glu-tRNA(Gln) amidotransferase subunit GatA [Candidatus Helarchaeota archaeon]